MDQRNLILAIVISVSILLGFQFLFEQPRQERERAAREAEQQLSEQAGGTGQTAVSGARPPSAVRGPGGAAAPVVGLAPPSRAVAIGKTGRVKFDSKRIHGSISLTGARIDDLTLADYRMTIDEDSDPITLLSPPGAPQAYFAQFGWVSATDGVEAPGPDSVWTANHYRLRPGNPVTLRWDNGAGVGFTQVIELDEDYLFTVTQRVRNNSGKSVTLHPFGLVSRSGTPEISGFFILHEGLLGVFDSQLEEVDYDELQDLREEKKGSVDNLCRTDPRFTGLPASSNKSAPGTIEKCSQGGWIGITDKYWLTALVPDQKSVVGTRFTNRLEANEDKYQVDFMGAAATVPPGGSIETVDRLFAGAKEVDLLDGYRDNPGIDRFDLAVDWGWLWFLTKPIFQALQYFNNNILGNFGLSILLLTVLIKLAFFPLANKSYRAMSRMKKLQPKMVEIRETYKDDRARQNQEMMALYRNENANPMAGCFPILIQIPVFFALYKVLFVSIEMRHAPFFGWIQDLSAPDPLGVLTAFGLVEWDIPQMLLIANVGIWPMIMGGTMYLQQKLNPQPADPTQAKIFMMLPIVFTFMLGRFPAGLVIYWAWNNLLSIAQQWVIMHKMGVSVSGKSTTPPGMPGKAKAAAASAAASGNPGKSKRKRKTEEASQAKGPGQAKGKGKDKDRSKRKRSTRDAG